ncbi:MAG: RNB domain-containing ribonuclease [Puniceicoccaceae bacterium]|nr:MAG: RNB domain-containing ribonuclease [Puniceicoccaceae bacterium]
MNLRESLLRLVGDTDYVPVTREELASALGLEKRDRRKLSLELNRLLGTGELVRIKGDRFCLPTDADLASGVIRFRQSGVAIVIPEALPGQREPQPIYIHAEDTAVAMHGDRVVVRLLDEDSLPPPLKKRRQARQARTSRDHPEGPVGRVIRILERARTTITGTLQKSRLFHYIAPDDPRIIHDIYVPPPEQSDLRPRPKVGDKVVAKLHEWEQRHINPEGEIIEVLGRTFEPSAEFKAILHKYNLPDSFPETVEKDVATLPKAVRPGEDLKGRTDLRHLHAFTIDPDDAKDFDDALSIEYGNQGRVRIGIHIADVAAYVRPNSALDREAQKRGNSTYLVGAVIPMLPHALSNGLCSLKEAEDRLTKTVFLAFDARGRLSDISFANSVIHSRKRLTYHQAYAMLMEDDLGKIRKLPLPPAHQTGFTGRPLADLDDKELGGLQRRIRDLWTIASGLRKNRMKQGSLDLDMPEAKIFVDEKGYADRIEKIEQDESHQLIEEFMLAANAAVARRLREVNLPAIYRVHDDPDEEKLAELREYLGTFGVTAGDLTNRKEMARTVSKLRDHPQGYILRIQVLRSMRKAVYRASPDGHYGLCMKDYLHFTSPIRRYSDLVVHRVFEALLVKHEGQPALPGSQARYDLSRATSMAEHLSLTEQNSMEAERESVKVKQLEYFERELKKTRRTAFAAVITEVRNHGLFVELSELMVFGLVHVSTLKDDLYHLDDDGAALVGRRSRRRFAVGQKVMVQTERVDRFKRQVDFRIAGSAPAAEERPSGEGQPRAAEKPSRSRPGKSSSRRQSKPASSSAKAGKKSARRRRR